MKVGLLGFGTVGSGVYEIIKSKPTCFFDDIDVKKILVKDEKDKVLDIITINVDEILDDKEIDVVVEVMGGIHPAYEYIMRALKNKKSVVTANKAVVAEHLKEFTETAEKNGVFFEYEASVCGGIPWLASLKKAERIDEITEVSGIFNGTTNFILDNMTKNGCDFDEILKEAQGLGYAEADPSADIDGIDIMRKLIITASLVFDIELKESDINVKGIRDITKKDIENFEAMGYVVKLIATAIKNETGYCAAVEPVLFNRSELEAAVPLNFNLGTIKGKTIGELKFYGQGAGKFPTGNAVVQDIIDISLKKGEGAVKKFDKKLLRNSELISGSYYIRIENEEMEEVFMDYVEEIVERPQGKYYLTEEITSDIMREIASKFGDKKIFYARVK